MSLLSSKQKAALCCLAKKAWLAQGKPGAQVATETAALTEWRRAQVQEVCGASGLQTACNDDYLPLKRRFEMLAGSHVAEFNTALRENGEVKRRHIYNLGAALADGDLPATYAESIARAKFSKGIGDLNDNQLRDLVITVRARVRARLKKKAQVPA